MVVVSSRQVTCYRMLERLLLATLLGRLLSFTFYGISIFAFLQMTVIIERNFVVECRWQRKLHLVLLHSLGNGQIACLLVLMIAISNDWHAEAKVDTDLNVILLKVLEMNATRS